MTKPTTSDTYSDFSLRRSLRQVRHLMKRPFDDDAQRYRLWIEHCEMQLAEALGREDVSGMSILEIGPGQGLERAQYFGRNNTVTTIDLDEIVAGFDIGAYWRMLRANGAGRVVKTLGRNTLIAPRQRRAWATAIGGGPLPQPKRERGDFCQPDVAESLPGYGNYDVVVSWSVFEHLADPSAAIENVIAALRPGGVFLLSIHNYTANDGHHDIRAFTGAMDELPPWGHLRESTAAEIRPSAYLNELRVSDWESVFESLAPGTTMSMEKGDHPALYGDLLVGELREELSDYSLDELLTINVVAVWQKPMESDT